jgi:hypothetical protein
MIKPSGDKYNYVWPIKSAITHLKKEGYSPEQYKKHQEKLIESIEVDDENYTTRGVAKNIGGAKNAAGAKDGKKLKAVALKEIDKAKKGIELAEFYKQFEEEKLARKIYDFDDMILNVLEKLKSRILPADALLREVLDKATIALFGKNNLAEPFNEEAISLLPGAIVEITCKYDNVKRKVKVNARVICDFNDMKLMGIVNGSLGVIESFSEDVIAVRYDGNTTVCYDSNKPVPFRPAYAMSIHKSQGKTLDRVIVCLNKQSSIFTDGQAYVALSRCKSFSSTYIVIEIHSSSKSRT